MKTWKRAPGHKWYRCAKCGLTYFRKTAPTCCGVKVPRDSKSSKRNPPNMYAIKKPGSSQWWGNQARDVYHFKFGWGMQTERNRYTSKAEAKKEAKRVGGEVYQVFSGGWAPMKANPKYRRNPSHGHKQDGEGFAIEHFTAPESIYVDSFSGPIKGRALEVIETGTGRRVTSGKIKVKIEETRGGYRKGEVVVLGAHDVFPRSHLKKRGIYKRISTLYAWDKK